jgi:hypothetical protein
MDKHFEQSLVALLNNWHENISLQNEPIVAYEFSKNKFRNKYLEKTGEFLKITKRLETIQFNKICTGLAQNYELTESLIDEYLEWCFENYDFFIKKYKTFSLISCANFSSEWTKEFLKFDFASKTTLHDLSEIEVHKSMLHYFEKYGIPLVATKLQKEKNFDSKFLCDLIIKKLQELPNTKEGLSKLKNMLRITVENAPYSPEILFGNYKKSLADLFIYFGDEPWAKND